LNTLGENNSALSMCDDDDDDIDDVNRSFVGVMAFVRHLDGVKKGFASLLESMQALSATTAAAASVPGEEGTKDSKDNELVNRLYIGFQDGLASATDAQLADYFAAFCTPMAAAMRVAGVRRVTFMVTRKDSELKTPQTSISTLEGGVTAYFTFRSHINYAEDVIGRHIEPAYAYYMELNRLRNFNLTFVPTTNRTVHLFGAVPKVPLKVRAGAYDGRRYFARVIVRSAMSILPDSFRAGDGSSDEASVAVNLESNPQIEYAFVEALHQLSIALRGEAKKWRNNHVLINFMGSLDARMDVKYVEALARLLARRYAVKVKELNVLSVELVTHHKNEESVETSVSRVLCTNPTGYHLRVDTYEQVGVRDRIMFFSFVVVTFGVSARACVWCELSPRGTTCVLTRTSR
jgi:acetyl-CoA carboxylase/biotin carboxylase 1